MRFMVLRYAVMPASSRGQAQDRPAGRRDRAVPPAARRPAAVRRGPRRRSRWPPPSRSPSSPGSTTSARRCGCATPRTRDRRRRRAPGRGAGDRVGRGCRPVRVTGRFAAADADADADAFARSARAGVRADPERTDDGGRRVADRRSRGGRRGRRPRCVAGAARWRSSPTRPSSRRSLLDVDAALLDRSGPVHPDVAAQMARGVRARLGADLGLATTGVAGPAGSGRTPARRGPRRRRVGRRRPGAVAAAPPATARRSGARQRGAVLGGARWSRR